MLKPKTVFRQLENNGFDIFTKKVYVKRDEKILLALKKICFSTLFL